MALSKKEELQLLDLLKQEEDYFKYNKIDIYFGDTDYTAPDGTIIHSRDAYPKHLEFFEAGAQFALRAFIAGNQCGKSTAGLVETVYHATGVYPKWWKGKRFNRPVQIWMCGDRSETIRDGLQEKLLGSTVPSPEEPSSGLLKQKYIIKLSALAGMQNAIGQYFIKHISGGTSVITVKKYEAGRTAFESATIDIVHLDEECPRDIFSECLTRTMKNKGILYLTFTPDSGLTETVEFFLDKNNGADKHVTTVGWDNAPHLDTERKKLLLASYSAHERDCRSKGTPYLGKGKIYNFNEDQVVINPIKIEPWWPRVFGMDVGYAHPTAVLWAAWDRENDIVYIYGEYKRAGSKPSEDANAILARGKWIPGVIDTSSKAESKTADGARLIDIYERYGIDLTVVTKGAGSVEEGILEVSDRFEGGRLKIFNTCVETLDEIRLYRRDDNGKIVKKKDDLMDAMRYMVRDGLELAIVQPSRDRRKHSYEQDNRDAMTGY